MGKETTYEVSLLWVIAAQLWVFIPENPFVNIRNLAINLIWMCYIRLDKHFDMTIFRRLWFWDELSGLRKCFTWAMSAVLWRQRNCRLIRPLWYRELWYNCWVIWYRIYFARFIRTVYRRIVSHVLGFYCHFMISQTVSLGSMALG